MLNKNSFPVDKRFAVLATLLYAVLVVVLAFCHEVWRDEVVPMSMVAQSSSFADLFDKLHNYGHPALWAFVLYAAYQIVPHFFVLKVVNLAVSIGAVFIFLLRAPFTRLQRLLFIFGMFPFYIYPVVNRNYGISMLLVFLFCLLYRRRFERFVLLGAVLFLLANAHVHSLITVLAITASLVFEFLFFKESRQRWLVKPMDTFAGFALIAAGILSSLALIIPDHTSSIFHPDLTFRSILGGIARAVYNPGAGFLDIFYPGGTLMANFVIWMMLIYLLNNARLLIMFAGATFGLAFFFQTMFTSIDVRHQGAFFLVFMMTLWLDRAVMGTALLYPLNLKFFERARRIVARHKDSFLTFILIIQILMAIPLVREEIVRPYSSSMDLALFLKQHPELSNAVLIGEPDVILEPLPYYLNNRLYLSREERFGQYAQMTTQSKSEYSLSELLNVARKLKANTRSPVVILIRPELSPNGPFMIKVSRRTFQYSPQSLEEFNNATVKLASFRKAIKDERYDVYLLK